MRSAPLALSDTPSRLRLTAASFPVEWRYALLELIAGYCEGEPDDNAFALDAALARLPVS